mmetsp:Transcript_22924/g.74001  ORF Transcript_22924/g.74001 Transcript_22924/m.74001 type:complete len:475 (-) Transcript_22924:635-2059(-)
MHKHNTKGIIVSWAVRNWFSAEHVNPRNPEEVVALFWALGYECDAAAQETLASAGLTSKAFHSEFVLVLRRRAPPLGGADAAAPALQENLYALRAFHAALVGGQSSQTLRAPPPCCESRDDMELLVRVSHFEVCFDRDQFTFERCCEDEPIVGVGVNGPPCFPGGGMPSYRECCGWNIRSGRVARTQGADAGPPVLLYHLEKAGGTSVRNYLRRALVSPLLIVREFDKMAGELWAPDTFKIGLAREPCAYYLSLYHFGFKGFHWLEKSLTRQGLFDRFYGGSGRGSKAQFRDFVTFISGAEGGNGSVSESMCGLMSMRVWTQLLEPTAMDEINEFLGRGASCNRPDLDEAGPCPCPLGDFARRAPAALRRKCWRDITEDAARLAAFDCWLRTEHLQADHAECMRKYASKGGLFLSGWEERTLEAHNVGSYGACEDWYDDDLAEFVYRMDGALARRFGYTGKRCEKHPGNSMPRL